MKCIRMLETRKPSAILWGLWPPQGLASLTARSPGADCRSGAAGPSVQEQGRVQVMWCSGESKRHEHCLCTLGLWFRLLKVSRSQTLTLCRPKETYPRTGLATCSSKRLHSCAATADAGNRDEIDCAPSLITSHKYH